MVHYRKSTAGLGAPEKRAREYWKLDDQRYMSAYEARSMLDKRNFYYRKSASRQQLIACVLRSDRRLPSYERLSNWELHKLCQDRGRKWVGKHQTNNAVYIAELDKLAEANVFTRLMDLPPELRLQVYEHHFGSFEEVGMFTEPPITAVSHGLREEARPLFYSTHRFESIVDHDKTGRHQLSALTNRVVDEMPSSAFGLMRKLRVCGVHPRSHNYLICDIDLGGKDAPARVEKCCVRGYLDFKPHRQELGDAKARMEDV
ncbi:hypothetical protein LTR17_016705 [Elasticomyces elasticus]|nr:hypothetical protein LTR17_016705 [Elasticomyces elasticus]